MSKFLWGCLGFFLEPALQTLLLPAPVCILADHSTGMIDLPTTCQGSSSSLQSPGALKLSYKLFGTGNT